MYPNARSRGLVNIWVAILIVVFLAFMGLAIDEFYTVYTAQQLQVGADSAALAGALYVRVGIDQARTASVNLAAANRAGGSAIGLNRNDSNASGGDIVVGIYNRAAKTFTPTNDPGDAPNAVKVVARRTAGSVSGPLSLLFGYMFGAPTAQPQRTAIGMVGGELNIGLLLTNTTKKSALTVNGTASSLIINDGAIYVNSSSGTAASASGSPTIVADEILIHGGMDPSFTAITFGREVFTGVDAIADPLAALPEPNKPLVALPSAPAVGGIRTFSPGLYTANISINTGDNVILLPGAYYINGAFKMTGGNITGNNVLLFIGPSGSLTLGGGGNINLSAMDPMSYTTLLAGGPSIPSSMQHVRVLIFQSASNSSDMNITGNSSMALNGRIYLRNQGATLNVGGSGAFLGYGIVAGSAKFSGNSNSINTTPLPVPAIDFVFLVE